MKIIKPYIQFLNEWNYNIVNFSDLDDNWSAEYNISDEIKKIKEEYKQIGKKGIIKRISKIVSSMDETTYNKLKHEGEIKYHVSLPKYKTILKNNKYWKSYAYSVSKVIILLSTLIKGIPSEKEKIQKEIEILKDKLLMLDNIKEARTLKSGTWGWGNTVFNKYNDINNDKYEYIGYNEIPENGEEPIETYDEVYEFGEEIDKNELKNFISLNTLKEMFPVYNDIDFFHDWSVKLYKYKNYFLIQQSGWLYLFKKKV